MSLFPSLSQTIKGRVVAQFPSSVTGSGGIAVSKSNGVWTIEPDWSDLDIIDQSGVTSTKQTWVYDSATDTYVRVALSSIVNALGQAGAGISLNFSCDLTDTADSDPGDGKLRFNNASQNAATVLYIDDEDVNGMDVIATVATLDDSTATVKGQLSITKVGDATARLIFNVTALTDASGYTKLTVANLASSATNPFAEGDTLLFAFTRTGDDGTSSGDVTAASSFGTDNVMVRSDGTGKGVQSTGIAVDDDNSVTGLKSLTIGAAEVTDHSALILSGVTPGVELGKPGTSNTPFIDFHSSSSTNDYDVRFMASSGTASSGAGTMTVTCGTFNVSGNLQKGGANVLVPALAVNLTGGVTATSYDAGTKSSGTFTPDALNGNIQHCVNGGAFTLAPPSSASSIILQVVNNGSAGTITTSGFSKVNGDSFDTTNGSAFECVIRKTNSYSLLTVTKIA